jgi:pimeloyl-ACP methyl ester carboxylesterase
MQVIVNKLAVQYTRTGQGPVLVMLHGWADTAETFNALLPELEQRFTVVRINLAGFGGSQAPQKAWNLNDYAVYVRDVLQKIAISPQDITVLLGHSNGGAVAVAAVSQKLLFPKRLILIASSGVRSGGSQQGVVRKVAIRTAKTFGAFLPSTTRHKLRSSYYEKVGSDMLVAPHMEATFKKIIKDDIVGRADKITIPTLLIYAELDTATPPSHGVALQHAIQGADLRVLQGAGHFLHQQNAEEVLAYMKEFLT